MEAWANNGAFDHVVYAYPLLDKRIVEFCLGIPAELYVQEGYARYLYRYATKGILPDEIRWSRLKNEPERIKRLLDISRDAVRVWLSQAQERGWDNCDLPPILVPHLKLVQPVGFEQVGHRSQLGLGGDIPVHCVV